MTTPRLVLTLPVTLGLLLGGAASAQAVCAKPLPPLAAKPKRSFSAPAKVVSASCKYRVTMVTSEGTMQMTLYPKAAPITTNSFVFLARNRFFDGLTFHRVLRGFVIQGGDPLGNGTGGPGYTLKDEFPTTAYRLGDLVMAKTPAPDSAGSQFFVITGPNGVSLPPEYSRFGRVTSGLAVAKRIADLQAPGDQSGRPTRKVTIATVRVTAR